MGKSDRTWGDFKTNEIREVGEHEPVQTDGWYGWYPLTKQLIFVQSLWLPAGEGKQVWVPGKLLKKFTV